MRRLIFALAALMGCLCFATVASAQRACVQDSNGEIVCGMLVQPGYGQPRYDRGPPDFGGRDFDRRRDWDDDRRGQQRAAPGRCPANYTVQDGECKPYRGAQKCQKGYTVQDGECKPYTGR